MKFSRYTYYITVISLSLLGSELVFAQTSQTKAQEVETTLSSQTAPQNVSLTIFIDGRPSQKIVSGGSIPANIQPGQITIDVPQMTGYTTYVDQQQKQQVALKVNTDGSIIQQGQVEYRKTISDPAVVTKDAHISVTKDGQTFELTIPQVTGIPGGPTIAIAAPELDGYQSNVSDSGLELQLTETGEWELVTSAVTYTRPTVTEDAKLTVLVDGKTQEITLPQVTAILGGPSITVPALELKGYKCNLAKWQLSLTTDGTWISDQQISYTKEELPSAVAETTLPVVKPAADKKMPTPKEVAQQTKDQNLQLSEKSQQRQQLVPNSLQPQLLPPTKKNARSLEQQTAQLKQPAAPKKNTPQSTNNLTTIAGVIAAVIAIISLGFYKLQ